MPRDRRRNWDRPFAFGRIVAGVALAVDLATAALTYALSRSSVNIRAAFLHDVVDAPGSVP